MDIAAMSMALSTQQLACEVSVAVMNLSKDQMQQAGAQMVQALNEAGGSLDPNVGRNIDISI